MKIILSVLLTSRAGADAGFLTEYGNHTILMSLFSLIKQ